MNNENRAFSRSSSRSRDAATYEAEIGIKSEFSYLSETEDREQVKIKCECTTCPCTGEAKGIVPFIMEENFMIHKNDLELTTLIKTENDEMNLIPREKTAAGMPFLSPYGYDDETKINISELEETKIDISEVEVGFNDSFDKDDLGPELDTKKPLNISPDDALIDPGTDQSILFRALTTPLVGVRCNIQPINDRKNTLSTDVADGNGMIVDDGNSKIAKRKRKRKLSHANDKTNFSRIHGDRKAFVCPSCHTQFYHRRSFDHHLISKHENDVNLLTMISSKIHNCPKCDKRYIFKIHLDGHIMDIHQDDKSLLKMITNKVHKCPKCHTPRQFSQKAHLDRHILTHHNDEDSLKIISRKLQRCPKCHKQWIFKYELDKHMLTCHNNDSLKIIPAECKRKRKLSHAHDKTNFVRIHVDRKAFVCPSCHKQFYHRRSFDHHLISKHENDVNLLKTISSKIHNCPKCDKRYIFKIHLDGHIMNIHQDDKSLLKMVTNKLHKCPKCHTPRHFIWKAYLDRHILTHHNDKDSLKTISRKLHKCPKCHKQWIFKSELDKHMLSRHNNDSLKIILAKCKRKRKLSHANDKTNFSRIHGYRKAFVCPSCHKQFYHRRSVEHHLISKHENDVNLLKMISSKIHNCPKCDKRYILKTLLDRHLMDIHQDDKSLLKMVTNKCPICHTPRHFICKARLDRHILTHHNDKDSLKFISRKLHECPKCHKQWIFKYELDKHMLSRHNNDSLKIIPEEIIKCPKCYKQFISKQDLDNHTLMNHIDNKCPNCHKEFIHKYHLDRHILTHPDDKDSLKTISRKLHNCLKCGKQFISKGDLARHACSP